MLYADLHYGPHVRTFLELKSGINSWRAGGPRPIDEKRLDFQAGFLEVGGATSWGSIQVRAGRQELEYGSGRLVDVREGPNVRLSFDGFLVRASLFDGRSTALQYDPMKTILDFLTMLQIILRVSGVCMRTHPDSRQVPTGRLLPGPGSQGRRI